MIKNWVLAILNWSFFFHVSCDSNFDTFVEKKPTRISVFSFCWGVSHYYLLTYSFEEKKASIFTEIDYNKIAPLKSEEEIKDTIRKYNLDLGCIKVKNHDEQVDFLKEKKEDNRHSISASETKANFLLAFITTFSGISIYLMPGILIYNSNNTLVSIVIYFMFFNVIASIFNAFNFILETIKVRGYRRYKFSEFIKQPQENNHVIIYHYYEWLSSSNDSIYKVGLIKNAEKYCKRTCFLSIFLWSLLQLFPSEAIKIDKQYTPSPYYFAGLNNS